MDACIPGQSLFTEISVLVEQARATIASQVNHMATRLYWQIGTMINTSILQEKRAEYGKQIVSALATQLSWSHFIELLPLKAAEAKLFYVRTTANQGLSAKRLREQISRKVFERTVIADSQLAPNSPVPQGMFKDPYLWDFLGLKDGYLESDLENGYPAGTGELHP